MNSISRACALALLSLACRTAPTQASGAPGGEGRPPPRAAVQDPVGVALNVREPAWTGRPAAGGAPTYEETLAKLQAVVDAHWPEPRKVVTSPAPCVLRVVMSDDFAKYPNPTLGFLYQSTWVDLSRAREVHAEAFGRDPGPGPALAMTCAWLDGPAGFGLWTEVVTLRGRATPVRRVELEEKEAPRLCVNNDAEPEALAEPLRRLVALCSGG